MPSDYNNKTMDQMNFAKESEMAAKEIKTEKSQRSSAVTKSQDLRKRKDSEAADTGFISSQI